MTGEPLPTLAIQVPTLAIEEIGPRRSSRKRKPPALHVNLVASVRHTKKRRVPIPEDATVPVSAPLVGRNTRYKHNREPQTFVLVRRSSLEASAERNIPSWQRPPPGLLRRDEEEVDIIG